MTADTRGPITTLPDAKRKWGTPGGVPHASGCGYAAGLRRRRGVVYRRALVGLYPAKDSVVWTPEEVQHWALVPNAFITTVLREGTVLDERSN